jgi:hypothetical protein
MKTIKFVFVVFLLLSTTLPAQENLIDRLLNENKNLFDNVLTNIDSFEVQIIYTQINRDNNNFPVFTTYKYRVNPRKYFYPASTVKLPVAILAFEKLNDLKIDGLTKFTPLRIDSIRERQSSVVSDTSSENGLPTIANYIKKIFLVSDNDAYNRLYEFVGQKGINERLHNKGFKDVKIVHRFVGGLTPEDNRNTNPITFYQEDKIIYHQSAQYNENTYQFELNNLYKGIGYLDLKDSLVNKPFDFSGRNYISLETLHGILKAVLFPEANSGNKKFNLTNDNYNFLNKYMSMIPRESRHPGYDSTYYDSYVKYFMFGDTREPMDGNIRIFNKVGMAYGYLTDVAYIVDFKNKVEFMLSAVIHVNKDGIYNDGIYEYNQIGIPFLANLGRVIYNHELNRIKKNLPKLDKFIIDYK